MRGDIARALGEHRIRHRPVHRSAGCNTLFVFSSGLHDPVHGRFCNRTQRTGEVQPDPQDRKEDRLAPQDLPGPRGATRTRRRAGASGSPAVHTSSVCSSGFSGGAADCSCSGKTISKVRAYVANGCTVSSDTGSCSASGFSKAHYGSCCVCSP